MLKDLTKLVTYYVDCVATVKVLLPVFSIESPLAFALGLALAMSIDAALLSIDSSLPHNLHNFVPLLIEYMYIVAYLVDSLHPILCIKSLIRLLDISCCRNLSRNNFTEF